MWVTEHQQLIIQNELWIVYIIINYSAIHRTNIAVAVSNFPYNVSHKYQLKYKKNLLFRILRLNKIIVILITTVWKNNMPYELENFNRSIVTAIEKHIHVASHNIIIVVSHIFFALNSNRLIFCEIFVECS